MCAYVRVHACVCACVYLCVCVLCVSACVCAHALACESVLCDYCIERQLFELGLLCIIVGCVCSTKAVYCLETLHNDMGRSFDLC